MPISVEKVPAFVTPTEAEQEIEPGFYLGTARPSLEKEGLQVHPVLFSNEKRRVEFFLRAPKGVEIGLCTGADLKDYQKTEGVKINPLQRGILQDTDPVLVVKGGNTEVFFMRPDLSLGHGCLYNSQTRQVKLCLAYRHSLDHYGFTIELVGQDGSIALSGDSYIDPSSY